MSTPVRFGKYQLLERIAVGGMAEIFRARHEGIEGFHRTLAIKRILPHLAANPEFVGMLVDEAKIAGLLSHANIVQILDLGQVDEQFFIAMEFVQGPDLGRLLTRASERGERLPLSHALHVAIEVLKGLEYAHDRQVMRGGKAIPLAIVHRDVSPANVLVSTNGEVKVTDFGIAKASVKALETVAGVVKGRFDYMSPEQSQGTRVDRRADLFATGVVLYEMLTGRHPFRQTGEAATIAAMRKGVFTPPSQLNPACPPELDAILARALKVDPDARYAAAGAFRDALQRVAQSAGHVNVGVALGGYVRGLFKEVPPPPKDTAPPAPPAFEDDDIELDEETGADSGQSTRPIVRPQPVGSRRGDGLAPRHGGETVPLGGPPPARPAPRGRLGEAGPAADRTGSALVDLPTATATEYTTGITSLPVADTGRFGPVAGLQDESTTIRPSPASAWADAETVIKPDPSRAAAPRPAARVHTPPPSPAPAAPVGASLATLPAGPTRPRAPRGFETAVQAARATGSPGAEPAAPRPSSAAVTPPVAAPAVAPPKPPAVASPPSGRPTPTAASTSSPIASPAPERSPARSPSPAAPPAAPPPLAATPWHVHGLWAVVALTMALLGAAAGALYVRRQAPEPTTAPQVEPLLQVVLPAEGTVTVDDRALSGVSPVQVSLRAGVPARVRYARDGRPAWETTLTLDANHVRILDLSAGAPK